MTFDLIARWAVQHRLLGEPILAEMVTTIDQDQLEQDLSDAILGALQNCGVLEQPEPR